MKKICLEEENYNYDDNVSVSSTSSAQTVSFGEKQDAIDLYNFITTGFIMFFNKPRKRESNLINFDIKEFKKKLPSKNYLGEV
jgi:hypothetical protein